MISVEKFINFVHEQLLDPLYITSFGFSPRYSTDLQNYNQLFDYPYSSSSQGSSCGRCIWWHEEPLDLDILDQIAYLDVFHPQMLGPTCSAEYNIPPAPPQQSTMYPIIVGFNLHLLANSEINTAKKKYLRNWNVKDWYFFFHGFASLYWFREYKYISFKYLPLQIDKVFICLNHLLTNKRNYRLRLISGLIEHNLLPYGNVSAPLLNKSLVKQELIDPNLVTSSKKHIIKHLLPCAEPKLLDDINYNDASASISDLSFSSFWHVVPETIYYDRKLHLTEKIFKPIVCRRPFLLVAAPGNLAYLQSYGFRTFDKWVDESYDIEQDDDLRVEKIVIELKKLCKKTPEELDTMHKEMQEILDYNHNHFYRNFKKIIVNELVDNFEVCIKQYNLGLSQRYQINYEHVNLNKVKELLID